MCVRARSGIVYLLTVEPRGGEKKGAGATFVCVVPREDTRAHLATRTKCKCCRRDTEEAVCICNFAADKSIFCCLRKHGLRKVAVFECRLLFSSFFCGIRGVYVWLKSPAGA